MSVTDLGELIRSCERGSCMKFASSTWRRTRSDMVKQPSPVWMVGRELSNDHCTSLKFCSRVERRVWSACALPSYACSSSSSAWMRAASSALVGPLSVAAVDDEDVPSDDGLPAA